MWRPSDGGSPSEGGWGIDGPVARGLCNFFCVRERERERERGRKGERERERGTGAGWVVAAGGGGEGRVGRRGRVGCRGGGSWVLVFAGRMDLGSGGSGSEREREKKPVNY